MSDNSDDGWLGTASPARAGRASSQQTMPSSQRMQQAAVSPAHRFEAQSRANEARARQLNALYGSSSSGSDDEGEPVASQNSALAGPTATTGAAKRTSTNRGTGRLPPHSPLARKRDHSPSTKRTKSGTQLRIASGTGRAAYARGAGGGNGENNDDDDDDDDDDEEAFEAFRKQRLARRQPRAASSSNGGVRRSHKAAASTPQAGASAAAAPRGRGPDRASEDDDASEEEPDNLPRNANRRNQGERPCMGVPAQGARKPVTLWPGRDPSDVRSVEWHEAVQHNPWALLSQVEAAIPAPTACRLRPYQLEGVQHMAGWLRAGHGGLLSDAPGLGKRVQVIALLSALLGKTGCRLSDNPPSAVVEKPPNRGAVLILCNTGALSTWADLLNRWGYFRHVRLQNPNVGEILDSIRRTAYEVVLCTHGNYVKHHCHLLLTPWLLVVCDDASKLRAAKGKFYLAAKQLPCPRRIAVASDAFDLDINSLWHVMEWINPGRFGDALVFRSRYTDPVEQGRKLEASAHSACLANERAQELLQLLKPVALRRTADAVYSQLPQKTERAVFCPLTELQKTAYRTFLDQDDILLIRNRNVPCPCGSSRPRMSCCFAFRNRHKQGRTCTCADDAPMRPFCAMCHCPAPSLREARLLGCYDWHKNIDLVIATLENIACHVALVLPEPGVGRSAYVRQEALAHLALSSNPDWLAWARNEDSLATLDHETVSGKFQALAWLLRQWCTRGESCVILSHNVRLQGLLQAFLAESDIACDIIDAKTAKSTRVKIGREFEDGSSQVVLITVAAATADTNLTTASRAVLLDSSCDMNKDAQALMCAARLGQTRDLEIHRFVAAGTVEEVFYEELLKRRGTHPERSNSQEGEAASAQQSAAQSTQDQSDSSLQPVGSGIAPQHGGVQLDDLLADELDSSATMQRLQGSDHTGPENINVGDAVDVGDYASSDSDDSDNMGDAGVLANGGRRGRRPADSVQQVLRSAVLYIHDTTPSVAPSRTAAPSATSASAAMGLLASMGPSRHASALPNPAASAEADEATATPADQAVAIAGLERRHLSAFLRWAGRHWGLADKRAVARRISEVDDTEMSTLLSDFYATA